MWLAARSVVTPAIAIVLGSSAVASADLVNFNVAGDLDGNFNRVGTATLFVETDGIGAGGTRALNVDAADSGPDASASYNRRSIDFSVLGAQAVMTILYKPQDGGTQNQRVLDLGLVNTFFTGAGAQAGVSIDRDTAISSPIQNLFLRTRVDNASPAGGPQSTPFTVDPNRFYRLSVDLTNAGAGMVAMNSTLVDFGTDGLTPGPTIATLTATYASMITADPDALGSFRSRGGPAIAALDNFTFDVIPEPAAVAALAAVGVPGLLLRRRARRTSH
jgi:hypothetical protein